MISEKETKKVIEALMKLKINIIDIQILIFTFEKKYSIGELQTKVGVAYKNLSPHLKRLKETGLITITDEGLGKKKFVRANIENEGVFDFIAGTLSLFGTKEIRVEIKNKKETNK